MHRYAKAKHTRTVTGMHRYAKAKHAQTQKEDSTRSICAANKRVTRSVSNALAIVEPLYCLCAQEIKQLGVEALVKVHDFQWTCECGGRGLLRSYRKGTISIHRNSNKCRRYFPRRLRELGKNSVTKPSTMSFQSTPQKAPPTKVDVQHLSAVCRGYWKRIDGLVLVYRYMNSLQYSNTLNKWLFYYSEFPESLIPFIAYDKQISNLIKI